MKARCPNSPEHKRFNTVAHVQADFVVDEEGNLLELEQILDVTSDPDPGNTWTCCECDAEAIVEP